MACLWTPFRLSRSNTAPTGLPRWPQHDLSLELSAARAHSNCSSSQPATATLVRLGPGTPCGLNWPQLEPQQDCQGRPGEACLQNPHSPGLLQLQPACQKWPRCGLPRVFLCPMPPLAPADPTNNLHKGEGSSHTRPLFPGTDKLLFCLIHRNKHRNGQNEETEMLQLKEQDKTPGKNSVMWRRATYQIKRSEHRL